MENQHRKISGYRELTATEIRKSDFALDKASKTKLLKLLQNAADTLVTPVISSTCL
jgi:hypothetical protein